MALIYFEGIAELTGLDCSNGVLISTQFSREVKGAIFRLNSIANSQDIGLVIALLTAVIGLCLGSCLRKHAN